jgi:hypothetical protein
MPTSAMSNTQNNFDQKKEKNILSSSATPKIGNGSHFLMKAQECGVKDLINECAYYKYDLQAMKMPSTAFHQKVRKEDAFIENLRNNIDPPSPAKPSEKAISIQLPTRKRG